jgi:hypothetical protein
MANFIYQCAVNSSHPKREHSWAPGATPSCCGKPMIMASVSQPANPPDARHAVQPRNGTTRGMAETHKR